jgi:transposase InsO family protein
MAWRVAKVEEHRKEFIKQLLIGDKTVTDLCKEYQISRRTGHKWINRHKEQGEEGLKDRSRAPNSQPGKTDDRLVQKILEVKYKYPAWGPKKVLALLEAHHPEEDWPSDTTVGNILQRNGLVNPRKYRKRIPAKTEPLSHCKAPNIMWSIDFKGWFLTKDRMKCDPLTITDAYSRFILYCSKLHSGRELDVWKALEGLFYKQGLPKYLRHDNGPPFATTGAGRLSGLSVKLIKAGVTPEWIEPGKPYQNGRHERMHRTLEEEAAFPMQLTLEEQQMKFNDFIYYFNFERPHEALGQKFPGSVYVPSDRSWDGKFRSPEYDSGYLVKRVRCRGQVSWNGVDIYIGKTLRNEFVGVKETDNGDGAVYFGQVFLGVIDYTGNFITPTERSRPKCSYKTRCY